MKIRASSFSTLMDCAHRWEAIYLLGMKNVVGRRAALGTAIHAGTAAFDTAKLNMQAISFDDAVGVTIDKLNDPDNEFDPKKEDLTAKEAEKIGITLTSKYCAEVSPKFDYMAVEMETVPMKIDCGGGVEITLTGTMDRARISRESGGIGIVDLKTGTRAVKDGVAVTAGHSAQLGVYELLFEHSSGNKITRPAQIVGLSTGKGNAVGLGKIEGCREVVVGSEDEPGLLDYAAMMFRAGLFPPNPKSQLCSERYCVRFRVCKFHG
jgi:hypothetical protein